jgi:hypothetical protein
MRLEMQREMAVNADDNEDEEGPYSDEEGGSRTTS